MSLNGKKATGGMSTDTRDALLKAFTQIMAPVPQAVPPMMYPHPGMGYPPGYPPPGMMVQHPQQQPMQAAAVQPQMAQMAQQVLALAHKQLAGMAPNDPKRSELEQAIAAATNAPPVQAALAAPPPAPHVAPAPAQPSVDVAALIRQTNDARADAALAVQSVRDLSAHIAALKEIVQDQSKALMQTTQQVAALTNAFHALPGAVVNLIDQRVAATVQADVSVDPPNAGEGPATEEN